MGAFNGIGGRELFPVVAGHGCGLDDGEMNFDLLFEQIKILGTDGGRNVEHGPFVVGKIQGKIAVVGQGIPAGLLSRRRLNRR